MTLLFFVLTLCLASAAEDLAPETGDLVHAAGDSVPAAGDQGPRNVCTPMFRDLPPRELCALGTGAWHTCFMSSTDPGKISENGTLRFILRNMSCADGGKIMTYYYIVKACGQCQQHVAVTFNVFDVVYKTYLAGRLLFKSIYVSQNDMILYHENTDAQNKVTRMVQMISRNSCENLELWETFKTLSARYNVSLDGAQKVHETDDCPAFKF